MTFMGANFNPLGTIGSLLQNVGGLLQTASGRGGPQPAAPAAQPAQQAPVDAFQQNAPAAPAQGQPQIAPGEPNPVGAQPAGGDLKAQIGQLVSALTQIVQLISQLLGGGAQAAGQGGAQAGANAAAGGATATAAAAAGGASATATASAGAAAGGADAFSQLQQQFGAWSGKGKNKDSPTGPNAKRLVAEAEAALSSGDTSKAQQKYSEAQKTSSPLVFDLDHNGRFDTTGVSTAKNRVDGQVGKTVAFDIDGNGKKENIEWMAGTGDGMLVDDRQGAVSAAAKGNGEINGKQLFGDEGGKYGNGYNKLAQADTNKDGKLTGAELNGLKMWVDNGDAKVQQGELKTLAELGITEMSTGVNNVANARGENLMQSSFVQNGQSFKTEDVWFANKGNGRPV
jgi:hypothetical protein